MSAPLQQPQQQPQQNELQQHHYQHHPPITTTIDFIDLLNSGFLTLYQHNKDLDEAADKHMRLKYDILLNCLNAKRWKPLKSLSGEDILVSPKYAPPDYVDYADQAAATDNDDCFDFENSIEGVAFVHPCNYGHKKSDKTLDHYNKLYAKEVLGSEIGRRLIQQHLPTSTLSSTPMEVDQVQVDNNKKLENDTFNHLMGSLKRLSIGGGTNLRQIDDALSISKSVYERFELLKDRHLEMEKNKRPLALIPHNEVLSEKKRRTDANQAPSTFAAVPMEENIDDDSEVNSQEMELECESTDGNTPNTSVKVTLTLQDSTATSTTAVAATATTTNQQPNIMAAATEDQSPPPKALEPLCTHAAEESNDELTLNGTASGSDEEEDDNDEDSTHSDKVEDGDDECKSFDNADDNEAIIDGGDIIIDNQTKLDIFAPALYWLDAMIENADVTPAITKRIGIIYQLQYKKVITLIESVLPSSTEEETAEPNTTFVSVSSFNSKQVEQLDAICKETAQLIQDEFPGYTGDLLESIELMLGGRVSTGTVGYNDGRLQGAKLLAIIKLLNEKEHFKLPVVLHQRFMLAIGFNRKYPERCDAVYEVIKATLFSSYRGIHLFFNDSLRMFYGSVQHRYLYGVLKALNPKRDIDISFGSHGLMPTKGNELVIDTINTREQQKKEVNSEIPQQAASGCVPVDPNSKDPPQAEINARTKELYKSWDDAGAIPDEYKAAIKRGREYTIDEKERRLTQRGYTAAVKNSRNSLKDLGFDQLTSNDKDQLKDLDFDQLTLHDRSQTEKGRSILQEESSGYFGLQSDDQASSVDIAALLRSSRIHEQTTDKKVYNPLHIDDMPIDQLASIVACIEIRKKYKLLPENAELKLIFYDKSCTRKSIVSKEYCKLIHVTKARGIGYIFTANLNRINNESIAIQMLLEVERIIPEFQVVPTRESGKKRLSIIVKEDERVDKYQGITGVCNSGVKSIEQSYKVVESNPILHKAVKDICGRKMGKKFQEKVDTVHKNVSFPAFPISHSSLDPQCMERIATLNEQAEKKLLFEQQDLSFIKSKKSGTGQVTKNRKRPESVDRPAQRSGEFSAEEHAQFAAGVAALGWSRWKDISEQYVLTRSRLQVQCYAPTYLKKTQVTFQVQVPHGLQAGQQLQVAHPITGVSMFIDVPPCVASGENISITAKKNHKDSDAFTVHLFGTKVVLSMENEAVSTL